MEDHNIYGGLGSAIAELLAEKMPKLVKRIGVEDLFPESGSADELFKKYNLDAFAIKEKLKAMYMNIN